MIKNKPAYLIINMTQFSFYVLLFAYHRHCDLCVEF